MYAQLDLKVMCKRSKKKVIFMNFGVKKFTVKIIPPKKF
jgi:hypothetical protein